MHSKTKMVTGAAVLALLLIGVAPAIAASNQNSTTTLVIQMAQAAHDYAQNLLSIAQQHGVDVTRAQSLISQGDKDLAQAQNLVNSDPDQAAKYALSAMRDYRDAARNLQYNLVDLVRDATQEQRLREAIERHQERAKDLKTILDKACALASAPKDLCTEAQNDLATVTTDLQQASAKVSTDSDGAAKLIADASKLLGQTREDLAKIAQAIRTDRAIDYIQNVLQKRVDEVKEMAQKANLPPSVAQQVQQQLSQVQAGLTSAIQDFKAGNFKLGIHDVQQAMQLLHQIVTEIRQNTPHP